MTDDETRYQRSKRTEQSKARHEANLQKLSAPIEEQWEAAMDERRYPCSVAGWPSKWADYDSNPEFREDYETDAPTRDEAEEMCKECPLRAVVFGGNGLCLAYRQATGQSHGVWGGQRYEQGKWMDGRTRASREVGGES